MTDEEKSMGEMETLRTVGGGATPEEARSMGEMETLKEDGWGIQEAWGGKRWRAGEEILGRYVVEKELGQGGMGVVYGCLDKVGGVKVAVKALPPELSHNSVEMEEVRENFQLVVGLRHSNIAGVRTLEKDGRGEYFLVMDVAEGESLRKWMRRKWKAGGVPFGEALGVLGQVASALDYAHSKKVVHRDVKPGNVVIDAKGEAKVLDFGLAAQIRTSLSRTSQAYRGTSGTGPYMAPEQWEAQPQDAKTDQYALAVMAYEMLAGRLPFENSELAVLKDAVLKGAARDIPGLPKGAMAALRRGMAKRPGARFGSCRDFVAALAGVISSRGARVRSAPPARGSFLPWAILLALVLAAGAAGVFFWRSGLFERQAGAAFAKRYQALEQTARKAREREAQFDGDYSRLGRAFNERRETMQSELRRGEAELEQYHLQNAEGALVKSLQAADWLEKRHSAAVAAAGVLEKIQEAAGEAKDASADRVAQTTFRQAASREFDARKAFDKGDFAAAREKGEEAVQMYRAAAGEALQRRRDDLSSLAQRAREQAKTRRAAADFGETARKKAAEMEEELRRAETALANDDFDRAKTAFDASLSAAEWLEGRSGPGQEAVRARADAQNAKSLADQAGAGQFAGAKSGEALRHMDEAAQAFEAARFEDAQRGWEAASAAFREAERQSLAEVQNRERAAKVEELLAKGQAALHRRQWDEAIAFANQILGLDAHHAEALTLKENAVRWSRGFQAYREGGSASDGENAD